MVLVKEINKVFDIGCSIPKVKFRIWEENQSCIAATEEKKPPLRTKYIALKYHFFGGIIARGEAKISYVDTKDHIVDIIAKPIEDS